MPNLTDNGDAVEKSTWRLMKSYVSKYETLWQMHVEPLQNPASIALRQGIDPDFEFFAMNHYSAYKVAPNQLLEHRRSTHLPQGPYRSWVLAVILRDGLSAIEKDAAAKWNVGDYNLSSRL